MCRSLLLSLFVLLPFSVAEEPLREAAETEFGSGGYGCVDTVEVAGAIGIDYKKLVEACLDGVERETQQRALSLFFWLSGHAGFDAASAEGHAAVAGLLLRRIGDEKFAGAVRLQPEEIRREVLRDLCYELGLLEFPSIKREAFERYSLTLEVLKAEEFLREQDG